MHDKNIHILNSRISNLLTPGPFHVKRSKCSTRYAYINILYIYIYTYNLLKHKLNLNYTYLLKHKPYIKNIKILEFPINMVVPILEYNNTVKKAKLCRKFVPHVT